MIQNEDGEIKLQQDKDLEVDRLLGGCICCTLTAGLNDMIADLRRKYDPEYVIVEASGSAVIEKVSGTIRDYMPEIRFCRELVLCDVSEYRENMDSGLDILIENQLESGDVIVLSKCDLLASVEVDEIRSEIAERFNGKEIYSFSKKISDDITIDKIIGNETPKRISYMNHFYRKQSN